MSQPNEQLHFWNFILHTAETLEECPKSQARSTLLEQLDTLNEAFPSLADPVEHYESFVVLKLSAAIEHLLRTEQHS